MERLDFTEKSSYNAAECAIHLNRYFTAKQYVAGKRVLDVACGEGYGSKLLKSWGAESVVGVDISESALQVANSKFAEEGITFLHHSAEELPFESNSFDVVVSFETIEHLEHPEKFLEEISRVVKFNGTVLISCPNDNYYAKNDQNFSNPFHRHRYTWFEFREIAEKYLGTGESWYYGFGIRGFSAIPENATKEPEADCLPSNMMELLNYSIPEATALIQADRYMNHWNACFYLGIWGPEADKMGQRGVFYPSEIFAPENGLTEEEFVRWKNDYIREKDVKDKELEKLRQQYQNSLEVHEKEVLNWKQKLLDESQKNEKVLKEMQDKISNLEEQIVSQENSLHVSRIERERTSNLLIVAETEKRYLWDRVWNYESIVRQKDEILNSRAVRLVFVYWKIRNKLRRIFMRK